MITEDRQYAATLIALLMEKRISAAQSGELDEWLFASDENMHLFELLTEERNTNWATRWFTDLGIKNKYLMKKKYDGWYQPESKPSVDNSIVMILVSAAAVIVFFLLIHTLTRTPEFPPFVFKEKSIHQVAAQLEEQYSIRVHYLGNSTELFTGSIPRNYSLVQTIDTLQQICAVKMVIINRQVFISDH